MLMVRYFPSLQVIRSLIIMLAIFCNSPLHAETRVFSSETTSITFDKSCKEISKPSNIVVVFDSEPESAPSGWFYGKTISPAEFRRTSSNNYEVIYPITRLNNLAPSHMKLLPSKNGFSVLIQDHIPEDEMLRESTCYFEKLEASLIPSNESSDADKVKAKDLFTSELLILEGDDLLFKKNEYRAAETKGYEALAIMERYYGKHSKETLNAVGVVAFALTYLERFDEALDVIEPYLKSFPDHAKLKELETLLQAAKKEQDELFRIDPDSNELAFESIG